MIEIIIHINEGYTIKDVSTALYSIFEEGNPDAKSVEGFLPDVNTPVQGGYVRIRTSDEGASIIESYAAEHTLETCELIRIEWPLGVDDEGNQLTYEPITYPVPIYDADGNETGEFRQQEIGRIQ